MTVDARHHSGSAPNLHIHISQVSELQQSLFWLLAIKAWQDCTQIQHRRLNNSFQHEAGSSAHDAGALVVVGDLDGNALPVLRSMAGCKHHLQSSFPHLTDSQVASHKPECPDPVHDFTYSMASSSAYLYRALPCTHIATSTEPSHCCVYDACLLEFQQAFGQAPCTGGEQCPCHGRVGLLQLPTCISADDLKLTLKIKLDLLANMQICTFRSCFSPGGTKPCAGSHLKCDQSAAAAASAGALICHSAGTSLVLCISTIITCTHAYVALITPHS